MRLFRKLLAIVEVMPMFSKIFYGILKLIFTLVFRILFRSTIQGVENIPQHGGMILAANHVSNIDPPLAATFTPRHVHFMAKQELFDVPILGFCIKNLYSFPVKRGASDRNAIRQAINILNNGHCLGLFPEGTRSKDGKLHRPEPGLALLAAKTKVPVIPAAVIGTGDVGGKKCLLPKFQVRYGKPIYFSGETVDKVSLQKFSEQLMNEIQKLLQK